MYHRIRWTPEKIRQRLDLIAPLIYIKRKALPSFRHRNLDNALTLPPISIDADDSGWQEIDAQEYWGSWMQNFVLRTTFTVPKDWDPTRAIALYLPLGEAGDFSHPEALAYIDGKPFGACDRHHQEILLRSAWADGKAHTLALYGWTGLGGISNGVFFTKLFMRQCTLVEIHQPTRDFIALARIALETAQNLDENHPTRYDVFNALNEAFNTLDTRDPLDGDAFYQSVEHASEVLKTRLEKSGAPMEVMIHATGHAHIDVAWLWTLGQTRRKSERTFYNVIRLMDQFPDYHFTQSQPQLYQFIKEDQPALFEAIKQKIKEGRWEPIGGMWVEADCNLSGAEALARQFLLGRTFFREHFGQEAESSDPVAAGCVWLCLGTAATHPTGRFEIFYDHQDRLESIQPPALRHLHVARDRWHTNTHAFQYRARSRQLRQHLQCDGQCARGTGHLAELPAKRIAQRFADGLWLR